MDWLSLFMEDNKSKELKKEMEGGIFSSIEYTIYSIILKIKNLDQLPDQEIKDIIVKQHNLILNYDLFLKNSETRLAAQQLFTNKRFLTIFLDVSGLLQLNRSEIICVNKIFYDYYRLHEIVDAYIHRLFMQISYNINNQLIIKLYSKLPVSSARYLAIIANSSFKDNSLVHRINMFLIKYNDELSLQDIVDIYCILFTRITPLFIYTMLETKRSDFTNEQLKKFDLISQAMIVLLHNLTSVEMKKVLSDYAVILKLNNINQVRFHLKTIQNQRILNIISEVEYGDMEILKIP